MNKNKLFRISPTTGLSLYLDCKKCSWLHYIEGVQRPRGIFPSLPGGMDLIIKDYFDRFRGSLPPELKGKITGVLFKDKGTLEKWRNWRTGLVYKDAVLNAELFGALDDCLENKSKYIPLDYKTKGSAPKDGDSEKYYQTQLDTYTFLLESNGYEAEGIAYLVYYYPERIEEGGLIRFNIEPIEIKVDPSRCLKLFEECISVLRGPMPDGKDTCEYCVFSHSRKRF